MLARRVSLRAACAALVLALAACSSSGSHHGATASVAAVDRPGTTVFPLAQRAPVPALRGRTLAGKELALADLTGDGVVVVNVWAAWCTECRAESKVLAALSAQFGGRHVRFLGIDEQDSSARARAFSARAHWRYPSLVDPDGQLLAKLTLLPSSGIPSTLVIDRAGRMAGRIVGAVNSRALSRLIVRAESGN